MEYDCGCVDQFALWVYQCCYFVDWLVESIYKKKKVFGFGDQKKTGNVKWSELLVQFYETILVVEKLRIIKICELWKFDKFHRGQPFAYS